MGNPSMEFERVYD